MNLLQGDTDMELFEGRPTDCQGRLAKEIRVYDFLDSLGIKYQRIDHEALMTIEACQEVDQLLGAMICKNLFLCKKFKTKDLSSQIGSARLSFAKENYMEEFLDITPGSVSILGLMNDKDHRVHLLIDNDVVKEPYIGCHPCINTSSLRISTTDMLEKIIPAMGHEPAYVEL